MHDVLTGAMFTLRCLVFGCHDKERDCGVVEHLAQPGDGRYSGNGHAVELVAAEMKALLEEVFEFTPER